MSTWTGEELKKIGNAEELQISSLRRDGTLRNPRIIWVVRVDDDLYVRSVNGRGSDWFRGVVKDVSFIEEPDHAINDKIDAAYATKYRRYGASIISHINGSEARAATIKLVPR